MHSALALSGGGDGGAQARSRFGPPDIDVLSARGVSDATGRSTDVATLLLGLSRYTAGLQIELAVRCRFDPDLGVRMHSTAGHFAEADFADGRAVAAAGRYSHSKPAAALTRWDAGDGREWSSSLWLTPAPPPGDPVLVVVDPAPAWTSRVSPWTPKHLQPRPRCLRSCRNASLIRRVRPFSRRSTYRPGAGAHGYFRR